MIRSFAGLNPSRFEARFAARRWSLPSYRKEDVQGRESRANRLRRARREAAPRREVASLNPLAPGTDLHHRLVREIEGRADEAPGRDDWDVGVRSFSCGVARKEKSALGWLGGRGKSSREYPGRIYSGGAP